MLPPFAPGAQCCEYEHRGEDREEVERGGPSGYEHGIKLTLPCRAYNPALACGSYARAVRVVASADARELIAERGGRLFVSVTSTRCCHPVQTLDAKTEVAELGAFRSLGADAGFEVLVPENLARLPDGLVVEARGRRSRRIEAFWNGCAWVV